MNSERGPERKHLVVIRHAKSSWDDPAATDHDRPLSKRGCNALAPLRDHVEGLALHPDLVLCSTAQRTRETLDGIRVAFGRDSRVEFNPALYGASADQLVVEMKRLDDQINTVFLIGHNPGVADLVDLLAADTATGGVAIESFPTAAVAVLSFVEPWSALEPSCAALESFWTPRPPR